jgi:putative hydrolase of the HAD superfamily
MNLPTLAGNGIEAIFFDMNGTLRQRIPDEGWQQRYSERLLNMLGMPDAPASFLDELFRRYQSYTHWADAEEVSLSEMEIWTHWITPELPAEFIEPQAVDLMLVFRRLKGPHVLKPHAVPVIAGLVLRGYRLGIISNTTSTTDLPRFMDEWGLRQYFEVVILSSVCGVRKPNPEIFWLAACALHLDPAQCAYLGNNKSRDVVGAHKAGFPLAMIIEPKTDFLGNEEIPAEKPDLLIHGLVDLLDVFPRRSKTYPLRTQDE